MWKELFRFLFYIFWNFAELIGCWPIADLLLSYFNRMGHLTGAGSDYAAFVHYLGITAMDISYTYDRVWQKSS